MLYGFAKILVRFLMLFAIRLHREGIENIPSYGSVILAANHRSNMDPPLVALTCPRQLNFMAKAELFENKLFGGLIRRLGAFPVKRGKGDVGAIKTAFHILSEDGVMLIFPEGGRVKSGERHPAKPGVAMIAQRTGVPVIPVYIEGDCKFMHKVTVHYGKPITFDKSRRMSAEELQQGANNVLEAIYKCR